MNAERREKINRVRYVLQDILPQIEELRDEEYNALAAMPESFQFSTKGEQMEERAQALESAGYDLQNAIESLEEATA